ncbi:MAG: type IX secretion system membrane protein PorP/SprF [Bacteroidota bacterium]|nr:type IX secretion system membrane protein PorP/SprF [Bacteroidota bacterium]
MNKFFFEKYFLFIFGILLVFQGYSQQDAQFSQYMFLNPYINPGSAGIDNNTNATLVYRNQWTGMSASNSSDNSFVAPQSTVLTLSTKIRQINSGIGLFVLNDQLGPLSTQNFKLSYSYHINLTEKLKLGIGVKIGAIRQYIDTDKWRTTDPIDNDQRLIYVRNNQSFANTIMFDFGSGLWLQHANYYFGLSFAHINNPVYMVQDNYKQSKIYLHYYLTGGYNFRLNENFVLTPSFIVKDIIYTGVFKPGYQFDISSLINYQNNRFWGGLSYRHLDALVALVGVGLLKDHSLRLGYAFDLTILGNSSKAFTSHEIMLSYIKPVAELLPRPIIRTPRFRY